MKRRVVFFELPADFGDRVQRVIHAGLAAVPMPAQVRTAIKRCGGCAKRREFLNRLSSPTPPTT